MIRTLFALLMLAQPALAQIQATVLPPVLEHFTKLPTLSPPQDWLVSKDALAMPIRPENGTVALQNPPDFTWPDQGDGVYQFRLQAAEGEPIERLVPGNFILWDKELATGQYGWQVRFWPRNGAPWPWSDTRRFTVPTGAYPFVVPDMSTVFEKASKAPRPRTFPTGPAFDRLKAELMTGSRQNRFAGFIKAVAPKLGGEMTQDPVESAAQIVDVVERRKAEGRIEQATHDEIDILIGTAFIGMVTGQAEFLDEARRRLVNMAKWSPRGGTGLGSYGIVSQTITRNMSLVYDWLYPRLTEAERHLALDQIVARQAGAYEWYVTDKRRLQLQPYDSHGFLHLGNIAAVGAILAGDVIAAKAWMLDALPLYLAISNPWGGEDGGYGNGMNYAFYDTQVSLTHWDIIRDITGIDIAQKAWSRNFGLLMTYMQPVGAPAFVFGDGTGHGDDALVSTLARGYALRSNTAIGNWYSAQQNRSFLVPRLYELNAPVPPAAARATGPSPDLLPNSAVFPTIGWAAMHSQLKDRFRNSVYFKSSPFGSYNHSHADQNSFVIHSKGRDLAIDSGYFYLYDAPHWTKWTKQSMAHNTITFNGGQGQTYDSRAAAGKLTAFVPGKDYDVVAGDATQAYGGNLKKARRTLLFLRPDTVLVYDSLEHYEPVRFEWNIHSKNNMVQYDAGKIGFSEGPASLCLEQYAPQRLEFIKFNEFTAPPEPPFDYLPLQWHGRFTVKQPERQTQFLALLRISCNGPSLGDVVAKSGGGYTVQLGDKRISIDENGATVQ